MQHINWQKNYTTQGRFSRSSAWYTERTCSCNYHYGRSTWPNNSFDDWMVELCVETKRIFNLKNQPNAINFNLYEDGEQDLTWHEDGEALFKDADGSSTIVSLSLGSSRLFEFKRSMATKAQYPIMLNHGDFCVMAGMTQLHYQHQVPKQCFLAQALSSSKRINLTFRYICQHSQQCAKKTRVREAKGIGKRAN